MTEQRLTGGTCVNFGCTPSKALIRCARAVHDAGRGAEFGFRLDGPPQAEFGAVMERVRRMRSMSSAGDAVEVVEQSGAQVYLGHTRFTAPNIVDVDGRELRFRKAVIAAGSDFSRRPTSRASWLHSRSATCCWGSGLPSHSVIPW
jgi:pyruvate/2-oxoglutarate dehydrogenase complex dihydrolipoamide dehydrogenase (E3) component